MMKLDLGADAVSPEEFTPVGHRFGSEVFPLPYGDASVDEVRASHVLEHFETALAPAVVKEWVRVLKPGGRLRIAVPDFATIAAGYAAGEREHTASYLMGGQTAPDDFHKSLFDHETLKRIMSDAGLVLLKPWRSELEDCAALPVSLNLEGYKPHANRLSIRGVMSAGRFGCNDMWACAIRVFPQVNVPFRKVGGAYWDMAMTGGLQSILDEGEAEYVITTDHDSIFTARAVAEMIQLAMVHPEADAIAPVQASRHVTGAMFDFKDGLPSGAHRDGDIVHVPTEFMSRDLIPVRSAHFGLTLIKTAALRKLEKPWFKGTPDANGEWGPGSTHPDVHFWRQWEKCGMSLFLAPKVAIGHGEMTVRWPGKDMAPITQTAAEWESTLTPPPGTWNGECQ